MMTWRPQPRDTCYTAITAGTPLANINTKCFTWGTNAHLTAESLWSAIPGYWWICEYVVGEWCGSCLGQCSVVFLCMEETGDVCLMCDWLTWLGGAQVRCVIWEVRGVGVSRCCKSQWGEVRRLMNQGVTDTMMTTWGGNTITRWDFNVVQMNMTCLFTLQGVALYIL